MKNRVAAATMMALALLVTISPPADADDSDTTVVCGEGGCATGTTGGDVVVSGVDCVTFPDSPLCEGVSTTTVSDDCANDIFNPCNPQYCINFPDKPICLSQAALPACVVAADGSFTNEPCAVPNAPCPAFVNVDNNAACGPDPVAPPVIPPPPIDIAAQSALNNVVWPTIDPAPPYTGGLERYAAGYQYSLHLVGYEGWESLSASATITQTVVQNGVPFSADFTATVTATPREVRWDMGEINDDGDDRPPSRHSPPKTLVCDNPGVADYYGDGDFQDWQEYDSYGGNGVCEYVFWGTTVEMGVPAVFGAEIVWDVELLTEWDGVVTPVGEHFESFVSGGHEVDVFWAVSQLVEYEDGGY